VRAALAAANIVFDGRRIAATVSIGVASGSPTTAIDVLIARADEALYRAKDNGRNRVEIAAENVDVTTASGGHAGVNARGRRRKEESAAIDGAQESCCA
jgi:predicted signal transduction protein with EAL and GGDEF domain